MKGVSILPFNLSINLFSDASTSGWGAHVGETLLSGVWTCEERSLHINNLEMLAVIRTLDLLEEVLRDRQVLLSTDNTTVVCYINSQGGTNSPSLCDLAALLLLKLHSMHTEMKAAHIPGCRNVLADSLERAGQIISTEWTLHQEIFRQICSFWGLPQIDLFAIRFNNCLPTFISPYPDERAAGVDALSPDWNGMCAYAYPPTVLNPKVLKKIS
jgi:ribonuclease HI